MSGLYLSGCTSTTPSTALTTSHQLFLPSGDTNTDSLADLSWAENSGTGVTLTYSFYSPNEGNLIYSPIQQQFVRQAMHAWENVANVTFVEITNINQSTDIDFSYGNLNEFGAVGFTAFLASETRISNVEVTMDLEAVGSLMPGEFGYLVLLHEIGHALGLKHPFEDTPNLSTALDHHDYTIMSYTGEGAAFTPQIIDIQAVQYLYGPNLTYNSGNTDYALTPDNDRTTDRTAIWDAGGVDLLDGRAFYESITLDLREGTDYKSQLGRYETLRIAEGANIENAIGGWGNDTLQGNDSANSLYGATGSDTIHGGQGDDRLIGGRDYADDADAADTLYGEEGSDILYGNSGDDVIYGGSGVNDGGETGNDILYGGYGNDALYGNGGNDTLVGAFGDDSLYGGADDDTYIFHSGGGIDLVGPFDGAGVAGGDILSFVSNINNSGMVSAAQILASSTTDGVHTYLNLGAGHGALILFTGGLLAEADIMVA